ILVTLDLQGSAATKSLRSIFGTVFRPVESVARVVTRPATNAWYGIMHYNDVTAENELLREKIAQQEGAAVAAAASVRLSQELLALNGLPTLAGINSVSAQVIGDSPSNFVQSVEIDQGTESGIKVGMPVLNAAGLVGKITQVFANRAVVMLITDPQYALSVKIINAPKTLVTTVTTVANQDPASAVTIVSVPVTIDPLITVPTVPATSNIAGFTPGSIVAPRTPIISSSLTIPPGSNVSVRETGILEGRGAGRVPTVRFVDAAQRFGVVQAGSPIVTAGGSLSLAPPDIVVGTVSRVKERLGTAGPLLEIDIVADLSNLSFVRILLYQPITERTAP
ncbi:MAG: rod shape-determining protein MreC, partial [Ilumatobacteraceae bacterium]|nr:rod shape-determining protein MreC [Ilumatobacteraceae bacterium]